MLGETRVYLQYIFRPYTKKIASRGAAIRKYFYRAAKLSVIHVNNPGYPQAYLLTRRSKTSFTFSYFFNYSVFFFLTDV